MAEVSSEQFDNGFSIPARPFGSLGGNPFNSPGPPLTLQPPPGAPPTQTSSPGAPPTGLLGGNPFNGSVQPFSLLQSPPGAPPTQISPPSPTTPASKTNIQGPQTFIGQIPFFLNAVLSTPAGALPKGPLWVIVFDFDNNILNTIKSVKDYEPTMPEPWSIEEALNTVTSQRYQQEKGCMFAQTVSLPGEQFLYGREGPQYNSYIRGGVGQGRVDFESVQINFLNTNVNFVDNVIRPWAVMTGHLGMIARPPEKKYRCNLTVYKLGVDRVDRPPFIAQQFNFWGVCPIGVGNEELTYSDNSLITKSAEFVYHWYTTSSNRNTFALGGNEPRVNGIDVRRDGTKFQEKR